MKTRMVVFVCCLSLATVLAFAQNADDGFQTARVVSFERVAANAQHMENADQYKISMRLGDTVYVCRASAPVTTFIDWTAGKEFPAKLEGKTLLAKNPDGQIVQLSIVGKKAPEVIAETKWRALLFAKCVPSRVNRAPEPETACHSCRAGGPAAVQV